MNTDALLQEIIKLAQTDGINAKQRILELAHEALEEKGRENLAEFVQNAHDSTYTMLVKSGVPRTMAVVAQDWPEQKRKQLKDYAMLQKHHIENAKAHLNARFKALKWEVEQDES